MKIKEKVNTDLKITYKELNVRVNSFIIKVNNNKQINFYKDFKKRKSNC